MTFNFEPKARCAAKARGSPTRFRRLTSGLVGILFLALVPSSKPASVLPPATYSLTLEWNPSDSPDVTGYHVYYGTAAGDYTSSIQLGNVTTATVSGLSFGFTYYFAITAADADVESDFSNEITYVQNLPGAQIQSRGLSGGQFTLNVTGNIGHTYELEATEDFTTWTVIGTGTVDANGSLEFTDPDAANFQQRFYRTRDTQP